MALSKKISISANLSNSYSNAQSAWQSSPALITAVAGGQAQTAAKATTIDGKISLAPRNYSGSMVGIKMGGASIDGPALYQSTMSKLNRNTVTSANAPSGIDAKNVKAASLLVQSITPPTTFIATGASEPKTGVARSSTFKLATAVGSATASIEKRSSSDAFQVRTPEASNVKATPLIGTVDKLK